MPLALMIIANPIIKIISAIKFEMQTLDVRCSGGTEKFSLQMINMRHAMR
jgi:hypothetical protein